MPFRNEDPIPDRVDGRHHADAIGGLDSVHIGQEDVRQKRGIGVEHYKAEISAAALAGGESRVSAREVGKAGAEETDKAVHGGWVRLLLECMSNVCVGDWHWDGVGVVVVGFRRKVKRDRNFGLRSWSEGVL